MLVIVQINVISDRLSKIKSSEYAESIKDFSQVINNQLKGYQLKEEQVKSINQAVDNLAEEVQDIKPDQQEVDYVKQTAVESKTATLIQSPSYYHKQLKSLLHLLP